MNLLLLHQIFHLLLGSQLLLSSSRLFSRFDCVVVDRPYCIRFVYMRVVIRLPHPSSSFLFLPLLLPSLRFRLLHRILLRLQFSDVSFRFFFERPSFFASSVILFKNPHTARCILFCSKLALSQSSLHHLHLRALPEPLETFLLTLTLLLSPLPALLLLRHSFGMYSHPFALNTFSPLFVSVITLLVFFPHLFVLALLQPIFFVLVFLPPQLFSHLQLLPPALRAQRNLLLILAFFLKPVTKFESVAPSLLLN